MLKSPPGLTQRTATAKDHYSSGGQPSPTHARKASLGKPHKVPTVPNPNAWDTEDYILLGIIIVVVVLVIAAVGLVIWSATSAPPQSSSIRGGPSRPHFQMPEPPQAPHLEHPPRVPPASDSEQREGGEPDSRKRRIRAVGKNGDPEAERLRQEREQRLKDEHNARIDEEKRRRQEEEGIRNAEAERLRREEQQLIEQLTRAKSWEELQAQEQKRNEGEHQQANAEQPGEVPPEQCDAPKESGASEKSGEQLQTNHQEQPGEKDQSQSSQAQVGETAHQQEGEKQETLEEKLARLEREMSVLVSELKKKNQ